MDRAVVVSNMPLVSVVIPFLNAQKFIQEAIESVFAQTYDVWELLVVDDGSTDGSTNIALQYAEEYPGRVRYLEHAGHQNRGKSASRNLGIQNAAGKYIAFLDADDVWFVNIVDEQVGILEAHPEVAMVYGPIQWWYSWTGNSEDMPRDYVEELGVPPDAVLQPPRLLTLFLQNQAAVPSDILVRREVIERIGGFEEEFRAMYEDQVFSAKICLSAPVFASSRCWYRYRQHPDSSCAVGMITGEYYAARPRFLRWLEAEVSEQGVKDSELWQALHQELWPYRHPIRHSFLKGGRKIVRRVKGLMMLMARHTLPAPVRRWLWARWQGHEYVPAVGWVRFGNLRRITPLSRESGYDRGIPIDRYYIERFISAHAADIKGRVLEIADNNYTRQFGGDCVTQSDVLHIEAGNPNATIVGDLTRAEHIQSDTFDCVILTQTLQLIYEVPAALRTVKRVLKPGGVVLATFPGISPISRYDMERWGYYWGFTSLSARRLFEEVFPPGNVQVEAYGNVLVAIGHLHGLASRELRRAELDCLDPDYQVLITVKASKPEAGP